MTRQKALQQFVETVKKNYADKIQKITLFGSYARGEDKEDSDIDVFIIGDVSLDELVDISFPLLLKYGIHISPHVMTKEHFNLLEREGYGFIKNVKKEGSVIHA